MRSRIVRSCSARCSASWADPTVVGAGGQRSEIVAFGVARRVPVPPATSTAAVPRARPKHVTVTGAAKEGDDIEHGEHVVDRTTRAVDEQFDVLAGAPVEAHQFGGDVGGRGGVERPPEQDDPAFVQSPHRVTAGRLVDDRHQQRLLALR